MGVFLLGYDSILMAILQCQESFTFLLNHVSLYLLTAYHKIQIDTLLLLNEHPGEASIRKAHGAE
jgi:hypothetical protein